MKALKLIRNLGAAIFIPLTAMRIWGLIEELKGTVSETFSFVSSDGYLFQFDNPEELQAAVEADLRDERRGQAMPDFDNHVWVLNVAAMREVFQIARNEWDDEVALLTISANTNWAISGDDEVA